MATSRRESQQNAKVNRSIRNMSPVLKHSESDQGLRRARSVPSSPDRRLSPSSVSISSNSCRPSSSFNPRTTSSRPTSGSASSSTHGAKQANTTKRKTDKPGNKPGATSVWPPALATQNTLSKDMTRAAKSPSTEQKSKLSTRPGTEKAAMSSLKLKTQKATSGPLGAGKIQGVSSARAPGALAKRRTGVEHSLSIQRTRSVPARQTEAPKIEDQEVDLLMEFDETESISTPSIEEHLQERLPDPVELQPVDAITCSISEDAPSEPSHKQEEYKNEVTADISEEKNEGKDNTDVGIKGEVDILKEASIETELKAVDETELNNNVSEIESKESGDETKLNEAVSEIELKEGSDETRSKESDTEIACKEAVRETELKDAVPKTESLGKEDAKEKIVLPAKTLEMVQRWRKDDGRSNEVTEEGKSKSMQERKNKVMALVGRFETAMSGGE